MAVAQDESVFLPDFGVPVSFAGAPADTLGLFETPGADALGDKSGRGAVSDSVPKVRVLSTIAAMVEALGGNGTPITVGGVKYTVTDVQPLDDGAWSCLYLGST